MSSEDTIHHQYMREALKMAEEAYEIGEVPVGCVFVHNGVIIGRGRNKPNETLDGTRHAEFEAIGEILAKHPAEIFKESDLYVTVEPCVMCAAALRQLEIRKVYFGCGNDRFGGNGSVFNLHQDPYEEHPPYEAESGYYRDEAILILRKFYVRENTHAPAPKKKSNRVLKTEIPPLTQTKP
ncbi:cytidine deaminase-like protein [Basidiobolus meristosporus CBS 931.73]|uniref:tRNA(adenine(34)) deaminase n=1 Tax=Basidiobolus meristosporus CBS 931.73 TaxID=1314790 RepID=A0A1Y1YVD2_9FUNG|nr:cytidine deaminase-like protein [Basidiobolus meristosporus CBS 931.73]|eukprot:ORY01535.1 cytidine deaminase-like protein [Basidiobolus meristosporus CBS 931.73]